MGYTAGLGRSPEVGMETHSSILAWRIPWTEEPGGLQSMGSQGSDTTWQLNHHHQGLVKTFRQGFIGAPMATGGSKNK